MKPSVIVWDLETVPDLRGFAAANDLAGKSDVEVREREQVARLHHHIDGLIWSFPRQNVDVASTGMLFGFADSATSAATFAISAFARSWASGDSVLKTADVIIAGVSDASVIRVPRTKPWLITIG